MRTRNEIVCINRKEQGEGAIIGFSYETPRVHDTCIVKKRCSRVGVDCARLDYIYTERVRFEGNRKKVST